MNIEVKPVFCIYDFRAKQQYIFRTNSVRESIGASALITWAYDGFIRRLVGNEWKIRTDYDFKGDMYINKAEVDFPDNPQDEVHWKAADGDMLAGRVIYIGGGSLYMMWRNRTIAIRANQELCLLLREKTYGLSAVCGMADVGENYETDFRAAETDYNYVKGNAPAFVPAAMLPFTKVDRKTTLPVTQYKKLAEKEEYTYLSEESWLKHQKYKERYDHNQPLFGETTNFDDMVTEKGHESLLAVIHIDGNNMGKHVKEAMENRGSYSDAVREIRSFSNSIQDCYVTKPLAMIREKIPEMPAGQNQFRTIIAGGDDLTLVCNARIALEVVRLYFEALDQTNQGLQGDQRHSACAGICVFHSHFPFSRAYELAEECCANAKRKNRKLGGNHMMIDFQHCFGGTAGDLDAIRKNDVPEKMRRPYCYGKPETGNGETVCSLADFQEAGALFAGLGRSNVKYLAELNLRNEDLMKIELERLKALKKISIPDNKLIFLHDVAQMYDLWFGKERTE